MYVLRMYSYLKPKIYLWHTWTTEIGLANLGFKFYRNSVNLRKRKIFRRIHTHTHNFLSFIQAILYTSQTRTCSGTDSCVSLMLKMNFANDGGEFKGTLTNHMCNPLPYGMNTDRTIKLCRDFPFS